MSVQPGILGTSDSDSGLRIYTRLRTEISVQNTQKCFRSGKSIMYMFLTQSLILMLPECCAAKCYIFIYTF